MAILGTALGLIPSLFKAVTGITQNNRANKINPLNPGYQMNQGVLNNARKLAERSGNYYLPGYNEAVNNIGSSTANAFSRGVQGASSSGDVLDLATKLAYGQQKQLNDLAVQNATGAENALQQSLQADTLAGQEYVNKNAYERQLYQDQLREKAALKQAGNENLYGALDQAAAVGTSLLNPIGGSSVSGQPSMTTTGVLGENLTPAQAQQYRQWKAIQDGLKGIKTTNLGINSGMVA